MGSFSERNGHSRNRPPRTATQGAPPRLRYALNSVLCDAGDGELGAYHIVCDFLHQRPNPQIWGDSFARSALNEMIDDLDWFQVYDLIESHATTDYHISQVNEAFEECGLAYELHESGQILRWDPVADEIGVSGIENAATPVFQGQFSSVAPQYQRAVGFLNSRPPEYEMAISEAVGAIEAVVRILTGKPEFAAGIDILVGKRTGHGALGQSLKALYGWASQLPGARHGRHAEPDVTGADASYAVRLCGCAIAYLAEQFGESRSRVGPTLD